MMDEIDYAIVLNRIYDEKGFQGIIRAVKDELEYGNVTEKNGLYRITTGGWSEDEHLVYSLICPVSKFHYHYCGYLVGGAFFFCEDKDDTTNVEMKLLKDILQLEEDSDYYRSKSASLEEGQFIDHREISKLKKENEELKQELKGMEELLKSYRKTIKHDAELLADATSNGYLPPLGDWQVIK